jgi:hypothetical protein
MNAKEAVIQQTLLGNGSVNNGRTLLGNGRKRHARRNRTAVGGGVLCTVRAEEI